MLSLVWRKIPEPISSRYTAVHQKITARNKCTISSHQQCTYGSQPRPVYRPGLQQKLPSCGGNPAPLGPFNSSFASGVMIIPGLIVFTLAPRFPQRTASAITLSELPRLESWYACK